MSSPSQQPISILKFGSSVLRSVQDLPHVVHGIYGEWRRGRQVIAVVSALGSTTDELLAQAKEQQTEPDPRNLAQLLATGEKTSAALLTLALERAGVPARLIGPGDIGLTSEGGHLDAHPVGLDANAVRRELESAPVLVLPGFVSHRADGDLALLGRGGSDLTAIHLAGCLGRSSDSVRCLLVKDVPGLFEWDPVGAYQAPRRFKQISHGDALELSGDVVQHKAIRLARESGLSFEVGSMVCVGSDPDADRRRGTAPTLVGPQASIRTDRAFPLFTRLRVAIAGHGTVGAGVLRHLLDAAEDFEVAGVLVRDVEKHRLHNAESAVLTGERFDDLFTDDEDEFFGRPFDVFIELAGGISPAKGWIERALDAGIDVVSANKAVLAQHGGELHFVARSRGARLSYSAAVGGAAPLLEAAQRLSNQPLRGFEAVLNGTTNHVVEALAQGSDLEQAVQAAQEAGLAEADPTLDLNGTDASQKTELLAREVFGSDVLIRWGKQAPVEEITPELLREARHAQGTVRLVASCYLEDGPSGLGPKRAFACLHPVLLPESHALCPVGGAGAAVAFDPVDSGGPRVVIRGTGAGRWPTAEAVLGDLFDLRRSPCRKAQSTRN